MARGGSGLAFRSDPSITSFGCHICRASGEDQTRLYLLYFRSQEEILRSALFRTGQRRRFAAEWALHGIL